MTDAAHMLSDFAGFLISLFAIWVSQRPPSRGMSFGWHRAGEGRVGPQFMYMYTVYCQGESGMEGRRGHVLATSTSLDVGRVLQHLLAPLNLLSWLSGFRKRGKEGGRVGRVAWHSPSVAATRVFHHCRWLNG